jgi:hypothetical protein
MRRPSCIDMLGLDRHRRLTWQSVCQHEFGHDGETLSQVAAKTPADRRGRAEKSPRLRKISQRTWMFY